MPFLLRTLLLSLCLSLSSVHASPGAEPATLTMAVVPCSEPVEIFEHFQPLARYIEKETGKRIELKVPLNCGALERMVKNQEVDLAFQTSHDYIQLAQYYDTDSLLKALTDDGRDETYGLVIVRKDSDIHELTDLRGKVVQFGPDSSLQKWTAALWLFEDAGMDIEKDLDHYLQGGCCEDIAFNVFVKAVDAGVVCDHALDEIRLQGNLNVKQFREIARTETVPTHVLAALKGVDPSLVEKVNSALLKLDRNIPDDAEILKYTEIGGFRRTSDEHYDKLRATAAREGFASCK